MTFLPSFPSPTLQDSPDSLRKHVELCFASLDLAVKELERKHREAAQRVLERAERACRAIQRFLSDVRNENERSVLQGNLANLRIRLVTLNRQMRVTP